MYFIKGHNPMNDQMIRAQSEAAYKQWCVQWREHASIHSKYEQKPLTDFENIGVGKAILCVANGYSLEEKIKVIQENQNNVDILCCDKTLGILLDHGITPTYCMVCDANVDYEKYMKPWEDKLQDTILIINACANPKWSEHGNWVDKYFFINKDIIKSEIEFSQLSGCKNFIPAGTNVSNAMVIFLTQSDNHGRKNFFGYDKILLIGYDYSWKHEGKYYAFNEDGDGKAQYMKHTHFITPSGKFAYTSGNLSFSCDWLRKYILTFRLPIVQCSEDSALDFNMTRSLESQIGYEYKQEHRKVVHKLSADLNKLMNIKEQILKQLNQIGHEHWNAFVQSV